MQRRDVFPILALGTFGWPSLSPAQTAGSPAETDMAAEGAVPGLDIIDAADVTLDDFLWTRRPIVVFADTPADPRFAEQLRLLSAQPGELIERDVVVITDTDPSAQSAVRRQLRPRGFQLALVGKDGQVKLRKPSPWSVREISRTIDKMPMRQREIRERRAGAG
ncbi:MAG: DUF4174 domain-containing protein [Pseudomonadota bacterium]